jgi:hypothetical protein
MALQQSGSSEHRAYQEAGHAVMSYLIRKGFTDKYVPVDRSLILPEFKQVTIEGESANWAETTFGLGSLVTVPQVLLAGYTAVRIKYNVTEDISPEKSTLIERAWDLLGGYIEEYGTDNPAERDKQATKWLNEMYDYVEEKLRAHWVSVNALANALLQQKTLSEGEAFEIIEQDIPEDLKAKAKVFARRTIEENLAEVWKEVKNQKASQENQQAKERRLHPITVQKRTSQETKELILGTIVLTVICIIFTILLIR